MLDAFDELDDRVGVGVGCVELELDRIAMRIVNS
jgi:hypothetical protein